MKECSVIKQSNEILTNCCLISSFLGMNAPMLETQLQRGGGRRDQVLIRSFYSTL